MDSDSALIADQARRIALLEAQIADASERFRRIRLELFCVGGPLNDNKLGYSREQMAPLARISNQAEDFGHG